MAMNASLVEIVLFVIALVSFNGCVVLAAMIRAERDDSFYAQRNLKDTIEHIRRQRDLAQTDNAALRRALNRAGNPPANLVVEARRDFAGDDR